MKTSEGWEVLVIQIPAEMHTLLKYRVAGQGVPMSLYVRELLAHELGLGDEHIYLNENQLALKTRRNKK